MGVIALVLAFILYMIVSIDLALNRKNYPLALVFLCYAITNLAYIWVGGYVKGTGT